MANRAGVMGPFPHFWRNPIKYCRWAAHEKPALWWSLVVGLTGPLMMLVIPPIKRRYGWEPRPRIPMSYPVPQGPRKIPDGYDDPS